MHSTAIVSVLDIDPRLAAGRLSGLHTGDVVLTVQGESVAGSGKDAVLRALARGTVGDAHVIVMWCGTGLRFVLL